MKKIIILGVVVFMAFCGLAVQKTYSNDASNSLTIVTADGKRHDLTIELAMTRQQQAYGLMNRTTMPQDSGMLFVFGDEAERNFWMKNTLIPLDMLFIKKDGAILHIHENAKPGDLTGISSNGPVSAVLELNGGAAKRLGIAEGDKVHHPIFANTLK